MNLRIGSWPGDHAQQNPFVSQFVSGLTSAGCSVKGLDTIEDFASSDFDVIVLHWAERIFRDVNSRWEIPGRIAALLNQMEALKPKTKFVWLVHNLKPHNMRLTQRLLWPSYMKALANKVDGALTLSPGTVPLVKAGLPGLRDKPIGWAWHPLYPEAQLSPSARRTSRQDRGWGDNVRVFGYCGQLRSNKGIEDTIAAFLAVDNPDWRLLIAGAPQSTTIESHIRIAEAQDPRIRIELGNLPPDEFREAQNCCDVIVAPFKSYLHSGSLVHALSAGCRVLTPATPFSESLQTELGPTWVQLYQGELSAESLGQAADRSPAAELPNLSAFEPEIVGAQMADFLRALCADRAT